MRDCDVRGALLDDLRRRFVNDTIRSELGLCLGATRVDVAVINGALHGYEIKSERDSLARLESQVDLYGNVLDFASVVASGRHAARVLGLLPQWWGLQEATMDGALVELREVREPRPNPAPDPLSIAQLLWRDEAALALVRRGERVLGRETRWNLWDRLAALPLHELQSEVRGALKARAHWPGG